MRSYGRLYTPDDRDRKFRMRVRRLRSQLQNRVWQSRHFGNQQDTPACVGFSAAHLLEASPIRQWINPLALYEIANQNDEWDEPHEGTSVRAVLKVMEKLGSVAQYRWSWNLTTVLEYLSGIGPCILGCAWFSDMEETDDKGVIHATGDDLGGHAVLIDGVSVSREQVRIKNSWGIGWGVNGRAWLSFSDLKKLIREDGECACVVEKKLSPGK